MSNPIGDNTRPGQEAARHQNLVDAAAMAELDDTLVALREGLADIKAGRTKPARAVLDRLARKYGISSRQRSL